MEVLGLLVAKFKFKSQKQIKYDGQIKQNLSMIIQN